MVATPSTTPPGLPFAYPPQVLEGSPWGEGGHTDDRTDRPRESRTYPTHTGRVLTDADIEQIAKEVETIDLDPTRAKILYPRAGRKAAMRSPREP